MRAAYTPAAGLDDVVRQAGELAARTMVFDVEPLVAYWDGSQDALDRGIAVVLGEVAVLPTVQVVCFSTNSQRRPSAVPDLPGVRVIYLASAGKPFRISPYRDLPRPGMVIGDQVATDGILARRLGYAFVLFDPQRGGVPFGPRLMGVGGRLGTAGIVYPGRGGLRVAEAITAPYADGGTDALRYPGRTETGHDSR